MPLTPMFSALTYDEDTDTFLIRVDIELPDHLVHIYFALDKDDVAKEIDHDKKRRDEEHKRIQEDLILKHIHTKRSDFDES